ncbi:MAG: hypothetical protein PVF45_05360 [Anaerolineae bacterium]
MASRKNPDNIVHEIVIHATIQRFLCPIYRATDVPHAALRKKGRH